jgi:hypothetical protein
MLDEAEEFLRSTCLINTSQNCSTGWLKSRVTPKLQQLRKSVCIVGGVFSSVLA